MRKSYKAPSVQVIELMTESVIACSGGDTFEVGMSDESMGGYNALSVDPIWGENTWDTSKIWKD